MSPKNAATKALAGPRDVHYQLHLPESARPRLLNGLRRRWQRERRRRAVGRAYDMALEIASLLTSYSRVLDVGCGDGFIAHHLSALLSVPVVGLDVATRPKALIDYRGFDGRTFPTNSKCFDAVLLCYVLHHVQDLESILSELSRVLRPGGLVIVYEDNPGSLIDRIVCAIHNRQWLDRTGPCTFRTADVWEAIFDSAGFAVVRTRQLSRWRNLFNPVSRRMFVLRKVEKIKAA